MSTHVQGRRLAAVLFADIVGYTRLSSEDEAAAMELVALLQQCSHACTGRAGGKVVKFIGDAAMAEFSSTESAVRCAIELNREFTALAAEAGTTALLRVGVHVGDVNTSPDGDIYGEGVNIAARIQTEAQPGQVLVSEDVWRQLRSRRELQFVAEGERELKGIPMRVGVFSAGPPGSTPAAVAAPLAPAPAPRRWVPARRTALMVLALLLIPAVLSGTFLSYRRMVRAERRAARAEQAAVRPPAPAPAVDSAPAAPADSARGGPPAHAKGNGPPEHANPGGHADSAGGERSLAARREALIRQREAALRRAAQNGTLPPRLQRAAERRMQAQQPERSPAAGRERRRAGARLRGASNP